MTKLSVNINKIALIRNAREGNLPDIYKIAADIEHYGAEGITVHPRPDERHIRFNDLPVLKELVTTEFNIEGYPGEKYMDAVLKIKPHQCTLVPDPPEALTSDNGWNTIKNKNFLSEIIKKLHGEGIRVSIFLNPEIEMVESALETGTDRIELYTGPYAWNYHIDPEKAVLNYCLAAKRAHEIGLGINAGHDLNLENLKFFIRNIPFTAEVSIGHALVSDALYYGLHNTIQMYKEQLIVDPT
ncbi:MAG: pyridoxine 5'-phosphate synthase [Deltaproteobacteria bacterium]